MRSSPKNSWFADANPSPERRDRLPAGAKRAHRTTRDFRLAEPRNSADKGIPRETSPQRTLGHPPPGAGGRRRRSPTLLEDDEVGAGASPRAGLRAAPRPSAAGSSAGQRPVRARGRLADDDEAAGPGEARRDLGRHCRRPEAASGDQLEASANRVVAAVSARASTTAPGRPRPAARPSPGGTAPGGSSSRRAPRRSTPTAAPARGPARRRPIRDRPAARSPPEDAFGHDGKSVGMPDVRLDRAGPKKPRSRARSNRARSRAPVPLTRA